MRQIAKPDLRKFVHAVHEQTDLACEELKGVPREALQLIVVRAMERGVEMQREAIVDQEQVTPLLPPPTEPPIGFDPPTTPKLPSGV